MGAETGSRLELSDMRITLKTVAGNADILAQPPCSPDDNPAQASTGMSASMPLSLRLTN